ncbi:hypothetical protein IJM86_01175 [bacterium]|nr:hypothetical protein [bacterium]
MFNGGTDTIQGLLFEYNKKLEDVVEENVRKNAMDIVIPVEFEEKYKMNIKNGRKGDFEFLYRNYFF